MTVPTRAPAAEHRPAKAPNLARSAAVLDSLRAAEPALLLFLVARATGLSLMLLLGPGSPTYTLRRLAVHWDASWYLDIAQHGYDHAIRPWLPGAAFQETNLAFFPVFPAMIRAVHTVLPFLPWGVTGMLTASVCAVGAAWGIYAAVSFRYGARFGTLAALLWGASPIAAIETAGYSESAFTMFAAWALYCAVSRRWVSAGVLSVLAGLTRPTGVAVAAAVMAAAAMEIWVCLRARGARPTLPGRLAWLDRVLWFDGADQQAAPLAQEPGLRRPLLALLLAPLGWLGFVAWTGVRLHTWDAYFRIQALWQSHFDFGASTAHDVRLLFMTATPVGLYYPVVAGMLAAAAVLFVVTIAQRQPLAFVAFTLVIMLIAFGDTAFFSSRGRFLLPAFPLLVPIASGLARVRTRAVLVATLAACTILSGLYGTYVLLYSTKAP
ncbi:hypothetical protein ABIA32_002548 [Streptacidiphilus sp. MAP12-20]|uniref:mannosyltransferase family protein n=1 Tax=Streptacidiphilus sp. MAP12-20 TaxID=3156299 RepID=UPI003517A11D